MKKFLYYSAIILYILFVIFIITTYVIAYDKMDTGHHILNSILFLSATYFAHDIVKTKP